MAANCSAWMAMSAAPPPMPADGWCIGCARAAARGTAPFQCACRQQNCPIEAAMPMA